jgi:hypothetical protein
MRISIRVPAYVYDWNTEQLIANTAILSTLDGWRVEAGCIYDHLDMKLVDEGVIGGTIQSRWTPDRGLEIVTDYWAPDTLAHSYIDKLRDETVVQLSDGIGEGGFAFTLDGRELVLAADTGETPEVELLYDGRPVSMPSRIARSARDGNIPLLKEALDSGEEIDSTIQRYTGLALAIIYGHLDAAVLLISKGANPNLPCCEGKTPLHLCALSNSLSDSDSATVARALLSQGADKTIRTPSGHTAAALALIRQKAAMLRVLEANVEGEKWSEKETTKQ